MSGKKRGAKPKTKGRPASPPSEREADSSGLDTGGATPQEAGGAGAAAEASGPAPDTVAAGADLDSISGDGTDVINSDGYLEPHRAYFERRMEHFKRWVRDIEANEGGLDKFSRGFDTFGLHATAEGVRYR
ncbi:alpha-1,4-glucan branching enzyme, partial [Coemansia biformis]